MEILRCGIHAFHEVLGIDVDEIRFFWVLHADAENARQAAYRVRLALRLEALREEEEEDGEELLWDTGRVESAQQRNIVCAPRGGFRSASFHYWQVTVWDQDGVATTSAPNEFFTAYPRSNRLLPPYSMNQTYMPHSSLIFRTWFEDEPNRWNAVWIGNGSDKPLYVRKSFRLARQPVRAIAFASGLGHFELFCNGAPASAHVLDPGWTNYHRTVQFVTYDLSDRLRGGGGGCENVLGAHVGNGFYAGDQGEGRFFWPTYEDNTYVRYGNELCFFAEVHLFYPDGTRETLVSGPDWRVRASATTLANIYASETHDRRQFPAGWDDVGFDDADWPRAKPLTGPRGKLAYQSQPPVVLHETVEPVAARTLAPGIVTFDLGQNMSTMVHIRVSGPRGAEVIVRYSETVDEQGRVLMPDPLFKEFETGVFSKIILAGDGVESWRPDFSFTSARYVQVEGVTLEPGTEGLPVVHAVVGRHVSSAARRLGSMTTDKEDVNALIRMCYWSLASNLFSYHTDCPQIEKFGWLEVTHLLAPATQYVRDMESLYTKILLRDILDAQDPDGLVPTMAPEMRYMAGPLRDTVTWGCAVAFLPELLQRYYGSTVAYERAYPAVVRYLDYLRARERRGGLIEHGLGDWGRDVAFGNHQANLETAIYYKCLRNAALMAGALGLPADEARYAAWADRIREVYNANLLVTTAPAPIPEPEDPDPEDGEPASPVATPTPPSAPLPPPPIITAFYTSLDTPGRHDCTMVSQAVALCFDLVPGPHVASVRAALLRTCEARRRMEAGEVGLKYLWNALAAARRPDLVLAMARRGSHPSYMRFLRRGETTLSEFWQDACRSKCHDMLASVFEWCYEAVLGVRDVRDGYRAWTLQPPWGAEFSLVEGTVECPYGVVEVRFEQGERRGMGAGVKAGAGEDGGGENTESGMSRLRVRVPFGTTARVELSGDEAVAQVAREGWEEGRREVKKGPDFELGHGTWEVIVRG